MDRALLIAAAIAAYLAFTVAVAKLLARVAGEPRR